MYTTLHMIPGTLRRLHWIIPLEAWSGCVQEMNDPWDTADMRFIHLRQHVLFSSNVLLQKSLRRRAEVGIHSDP